MPDKKNTRNITIQTLSITILVFISITSFSGVSKIIKDEISFSESNINCNLNVNAGDDISICAEERILITPKLTGHSICTDCKEYKIQNTKDCHHPRSLVMVIITNWGSEKTFTNESLIWKELDNGRATLKGTMKESGKTYTLDAEFWGKTITTPSPYENVCGGANNTNGWIYYKEFKGTVKEHSWWFPLSFSFSRTGGPLQLGKGANTIDKDTHKVGSSSWFNISNSIYTHGDIHVMMDCISESTDTTTYSWSTGETTPSIYVDTPGIYTVNVKDCKGCEATDSITVSSNSTTADAGEDQSICLGETTTLTAIGGGTYLWSTGETTASIEVSPLETTTYSVTVSNNNCKATDQVEVIVNTTIVNAGEEQYICLGNITTLTATGGGTYLWSTGETTSSIEVSPLTTTTYSVTTSLSNNCMGENRNEVTIYVEDCSSEHIAKTSALIYPTVIKASEHIFIQISSPTEEKIKISIYSFSGKEIGILHSKKNSKNKHIIDINPKDFPEFSSGMYFINIKGDKWSETKKICIK